MGYSPFVRIYLRYLIGVVIGYHDGKSPFTLTHQTSATTEILIDWNSDLNHANSFSSWIIGGIWIVCKAM
jgi:hypothetical protein